MDNAPGPIPMLTWGLLPRGRDKMPASQVLWQIVFLHLELTQVHAYGLHLIHPTTTKWTTKRTSPVDTAPSITPRRPNGRHLRPGIIFYILKPSIFSTCAIFLSANVSLPLPSSTVLNFAALSLPLCVTCSSLLPHTRSWKAMCGPCNSGSSLTHSEVFHQMQPWLRIFLLKSGLHHHLSWPHSKVFLNTQWEHASRPRDLATCCPASLLKTQPLLGFGGRPHPTPAHLLVAEQLSLPVLTHGAPWLFLCDAPHLVIGPQIVGFSCLSFLLF